MNEEHSNSPDQNSPAPIPSPALLAYQTPQTQRDNPPGGQVAAYAIMFTLLSVGLLYGLWFVVLIAGLGLGGAIITGLGLMVAWIMVAAEVRRRHPKHPAARGLMIGAWLGCLLFLLINGGCFLFVVMMYF